MPDLITYTDIHTLTNLNSLVEERKLKSGIRAAHLELEKVLGRTGYAIVYAAAPSFTALAPNAALYVSLLGYIKPWLAWKARERSTVALYAEADKGGLYIKGGQDYTPVPVKGLEMIEADAAAYASDELKRLLTFIDENRTVFTWYDTVVEGEERIDTSNTKGIPGISFRKAKAQYRDRG